MTNIKKIKTLQTKLRSCTQCPDMQGPAVAGNPVKSPIMLIGQAPGDKEIIIPKPFAWTAGKTLFKWFNKIGVNEEQFRNLVYMSAVCRCFPGKKPKGGDRVPNKDEIKTCSKWLNTEIELLQPKLILPVGKLAISQYIKLNKLTEVIGKTHIVEINGLEVDIIPLPHPSGASTWHITEPGKSLLQTSINLVKNHPVWKKHTSQSHKKL